MAPSKAVLQGRSGTLRPEGGAKYNFAPTVWRYTCTPRAACLPSGGVRGSLSFSMLQTPPLLG